jgi:hypothetical protein
MRVEHSDHGQLYHQVASVPGYVQLRDSLKLLVYAAH